MAQTTSSRYRDISLAFGIHPVYKDIAVLIDADAVKRSVMNLVLTNHYERPFHPEIGCDVTKMLFENITPITASNIQRSVEDVIQNFEPRVQLQQVTVSVDPDNNGYTLTVSFFIINVPNLVTITTFLERIR
jgi:phage baseplate assembly protein W